MGKSAPKDETTTEPRVKVLAVYLKQGEEKVYAGLDVGDFGILRAEDDFSTVDLWETPANALMNLVYKEGYRFVSGQPVISLDELGAVIASLQVVDEYTLCLDSAFSLGSQEWCPEKKPPGFDDFPRYYSWVAYDQRGFRAVFDWDGAISYNLSHSHRESRQEVVGWFDGWLGSEADGEDREVFEEFLLANPLFTMVVKYTWGQAQLLKCHHEKQMAGSWARLNAKAIQRWAEENLAGANLVLRNFGGHKGSHLVEVYRENHNGRLVPVAAQQIIYAIPDAELEIRLCRECGLAAFCPRQAPVDVDDVNKPNCWFCYDEQANIYIFYWDDQVIFDSRASDEKGRPDVDNWFQQLPEIIRAHPHRFDAALLAWSRFVQVIKFVGEDERILKNRTRPIPFQPKVENKG
ncbi:MAG: hypothetical protein PHC60_02010 [Heliobacteriaceae bacterium]|nr:hypothetical protein [Heliobacteriaceae bacterium]